MRSFNVRCTSYNLEALGKYKLVEFIIRCFFDTRRRWEAYEPPRARTLVHIIGQLIGQYKIGQDEKPAVLITDFKALQLSRNTSTASSRGASSPETTIPMKRRYRPRSSIVHTSLVTPTRSRPSQAILSSGLGTSDAESPNGAPALPISRQVDEPFVPLVEEVETESVEADEAPKVLEIEDSSQQERPKRMKTRRRGRRGGDFSDI